MEKKPLDKAIQIVKKGLEMIDCFFHIDYVEMEDQEFQLNLLHQLEKYKE